MFTCCESSVQCRVAFNPWMMAPCVLPHSTLAMHLSAEASTWTWTPQNQVAPTFRYMVNLGRPLRTTLGSIAPQDERTPPYNPSSSTRRRALQTWKTCSPLATETPWRATPRPPHSSSHERRAGLGYVQSGAWSRVDSTPWSLLWFRDGLAESWSEGRVPRGLQGGDRGKSLLLLPSLTVA